MTLFLGIVQVAAVDFHPRLDVLGRPDLALGQVRDGLREIGTAGDLVSTLPADPTQADTDLMRAHKSNRLHSHEINRRRETNSLLPSCYKTASRR